MTDYNQMRGALKRFRAHVVWLCLGSIAFHVYAGNYPVTKERNIP